MQTSSESCCHREGPGWWSRLALIMLCFASSLASSGELVASESLRWAFPVPVPFAYPAPDWADSPVVEQGVSTTRLHVPLRSRDVDGQELVATFYFHEGAGGFLRVLWDGGAGVATLATNLFEGVGGPHRRSLLIPRDYLSAPGVLTVVSSSPGCLYQVELEWLSGQDVLAGVGSELPDAVLAGGRAADRADLLGRPYRAAGSDAWEGDVIKAPLTDRIERIEGGLVFVAPLDKAPEQARLALWIAGPPVTAELRLQVNGVDAGPVAFEAPPLTDLGYYRNEQGDWFFAGWRKGTIAIAQKLLTPGDNEIELMQVDGSGGRPVAIKDMILQLRYPATGQPAEDGDYDDVTPEVLTGGFEPGQDEGVAKPGSIQFLLSEPELIPWDD